MGKVSKVAPEKEHGATPDAPLSSNTRFIRVGLALLLAFSLICSSGGCFFSRGQRYAHFTTRTPLPEGAVLIIGIMGGREPWDNDQRGVRRLALKLREMAPSSLHVETIENQKRQLAVELIRNCLDRDQNRTLSRSERRSMQLILYGQSFGGAAVLKLARQLQALDVPVLLTLQIDSVGRDDSQVPDNVAFAANLFQRNGWFIRGEPEIQASDARRTVILGNFEFDYRDKHIDLSRVSWFKKIFRTAHTKMDYDPAVWEKVEVLIWETLRDAGIEPAQRSGPSRR